VAERVVASQLVQQGHTVRFPEDSNQAGWDLEVDGIHFQVKNAADLSLLEHHFERYDYPVLANAEVADMLTSAEENGSLPAWAEHVHFVEGYSQQGVEAITDQALDSGDAMLHPHVPAFAWLLASMRGFDRYRRGQVTGAQAVQDVIVNGTVRAGLAVAGNYVGVGIGLLVFGPAGGLVFGSVLPVLSRTQSERAKRMLGRLMGNKRYAGWDREAREALGALSRALHAGIQRKIQKLERSDPPAAFDVGKYLAWRRDEDLRFLREAGLRLQAIEADAALAADQVAAHMLKWAATSTLHPVLYQRELAQWIRVQERKPSVEEHLTDGATSVANLARSYWQSFTKRW
jgi:hypothetical protein